MARKMCPVVHFELPAGNLKRMTEFYSKAFGWGSQEMGSEMGDYVVVTTTEVGKDHMPKTPGQINGGLFPKSKESAQHPSVVLAVENIEAAMQDVTKAGGEVLGKPVEIPHVGQYVSFIDTEGNRLSMLQPVEM